MLTLMNAAAGRRPVADRLGNQLIILLHKDRRTEEATAKGLRQ